MSDRVGKRFPFLVTFMTCIILGFTIIVASSGRNTPGAVYFGVFLAVIGKGFRLAYPFITTREVVYLQIVGIYPAFPGNITWLSNNLAGHYKRATGMAIQIGMGNLGGGMLSYIAFITLPCCLFDGRSEN
jgi:nitrate/nitrite transporter NarK